MLFAKTHHLKTLYIMPQTVMLQSFRFTFPYVACRF